MSDEGKAMKFGLQISTEAAREDGAGGIIIMIEEKPDVVSVDAVVKGFDASQEGAEAVRDLFRDMADAIDKELGNTPPDGQTRRGTEDTSLSQYERPGRPKQFNPKPRVRGKDNIHTQGDKPLMGLAAQRERKTRRND